MKSNNGNKEDNKEDNRVQKEIIIQQIKKKHSIKKREIKTEDIQKDMTDSQKMTQQVELLYVDNM